MIDPIIPSALAVRDRPGDFASNATRESASRTARRLAATSHTLADLMDAGKLKILAAMYDLKTGKVEFLTS
jgi:carbonic anhydrase